LTPLHELAAHGRIFFFDNTQIVLLISSKARLIEIKQLNNGDARESRVYRLERIGGKTKEPLPPSLASKNGGS
jgi:hypothetical protein